MNPSKRQCVKEEEDSTIPTTQQVTAQMSSLIRDLHPAHYLLEIKSFSVLAESRIEKYESSEFEAGGYKWKLCLYPNGKKDGSGSNDYISLYIAISDTISLPKGWEVNAHFKFFVYDHIKDKYLAIQESDGSIIRRFHVMKTEWGFDKLLPLKLFHNASNGYLCEDSCVFGAEVLVINKYAGFGQRLQMKKEAKTYTWKIEKFSAIKVDCLDSEIFKTGDLFWHVLVYPKGGSSRQENKGKCISIYIEPVNYSPLKSRVYAEFNLGIRSQVSSSHSYKRSASRWFDDSSGFGFPKFMTLSNLKDESKGYIVNDTLFIEAEITVIGIAKNFC